MLNATERRSLAILRTRVRRLRLPVELHRVGDELVIRLKVPGWAAISSRDEARLWHLIEQSCCCRFHVDKAAVTPAPQPVTAASIDEWVAKHPGDAEGIRRACGSLNPLPGHRTTDQEEGPA